MSSPDNNHNPSPLLIEEFKVSNKPDYQMVDDLKNQLMSTGIDTIIYYKRTSIGCCDFYYLLWEKGTKVFLHKVYYDYEKQDRRSVRIEINDEAIFDIIRSKYSDLKTNKVKENNHFIKKEGDIITFIPGAMSPHYRYSEILIFGQKDSIFSNQIKDTDFDRFTGVKNENETQFTNDNYEENINSSWYVLLTAIEKKVLSLDIVDQREKEIARIFVNMYTTNRVDGSAR
jgi:hypothetical protein